MKIERGSFFNIVWHKSGDLCQKCGDFQKFLSGDFVAIFESRGGDFALKRPGHTGQERSQLKYQNVDISGTKRATKNLRIPNWTFHRADSFSGPKLQLNGQEHAENGLGTREMWRFEQL